MKTLWLQRTTRYMKKPEIQLRCVEVQDEDLPSFLKWATGKAVGCGGYHQIPAPESYTLSGRREMAEAVAQGRRVTFATVARAGYRPGDPITWKQY